MAKTEKKNKRIKKTTSKTTSKAASRTAVKGVSKAGPKSSAKKPAAKKPAAKKPAAKKPAAKKTAAKKPAAKKPAVKKTRSKPQAISKPNPLTFHPQVGEREGHYRLLFEYMQDMVMVLDGNIIQLANPATATMLGYSSCAPLLGRPIEDFLHPNYRDIFGLGVEVLAEEDERTPFKFICKNKTTIDVNVGINPFVTNEGWFYILQGRDITERVVVAKELRDRENRIHGIVDTVADAIVTIDEKGKIQSFNKSAEITFGYTAGEVVGQNVKILIHGKDSRDHDKYLKNYVATGVPKILSKTGREAECKRKDGSIFPVEFAVTELRLEGQRLFTGIIRDITERKNTEKELLHAYGKLEERIEERTRELLQEISVRRQAEEHLKLAATVIENLNEGVIIFDSKFKVTSVNSAYEMISGYASADVIGKEIPTHAVLNKRGGQHAAMLNALSVSGQWEGEFWSLRKDGSEYAERISISGIAGEDVAYQQYAAVITDITKRKQDEERILYQANYDDLTGLPNRGLFNDRLKQSLASMARLDRKLGLMFIDLDGFKLVNDTLGHDVGDKLLQEASRRLSACVRSGDTVARLGGDEFTIVMPDLRDPKNIMRVAQKVLDELAKPFVLDGNEAFVSGSIGLTIYPNDGKDAAELLKNADAAMYRAKEKGKANYQFYTNNLNNEVQERVGLKNGLVRALDNDEFHMLYQPKMNLQSNKIMGFEALMRWDSHTLGSIAPDRFIPVMEETGQVVEVGQWAIENVCIQISDWKDAGIKIPPIAVNLSPRQLREKSFSKWILAVLKKYRIPPSLIELEITESMLMSDTQHTVPALNELHGKGIRVSMDDFGTGYSSLNYLKKFPIDTIKIDRSFVADITQNPDDAEIIRTIIGMGKALNRTVVAEGVETQDQLDLLREYDCNEVQGYYISRPLHAKDVPSFLNGH